MCFYDWVHINENFIRLPLDQHTHKKPAKFRVMQFKINEVMQFKNNEAMNSRTT
jgi:hypothetical protein